MEAKNYDPIPVDDFSVPPLFTRPRRRRSSMLNRWIKDQQIQPTLESDSSAISDFGFDPSLAVTGTPSNAYLAYPDLVPNNRSSCDDAHTVNSYDFVHDDDIPSHEVGELSVPEAPTTPVSPRFLPEPSSLRNLHFRLRSSSPANTASRASTLTPRSRSRISIFSRNSGRNTPHSHHSRSASLSTLGLQGQNSSPEYAGVSMIKWRPSVINHFGPSSPPSKPDSHSDTSCAPSRPSVSSYTTYSSTTPTTIESDKEIPSSKVSLVDSIRSRHLAAYKPSIGTSSSLSLSSSPASNSHPKEASSTLRMPFGLKSKPNHAMDNVKSCSVEMTRPYVEYASANQPRVSFSALSGRHSKKKKLVVSGVGFAESRRFEGVKRWCESFGEVSQITRMPNGDLHVHFKDPEVADTVCRLRAKVFIAGVGSVNLSWYIGNKH